MVAIQQIIDENESCPEIKKLSKISLFGEVY